MYAVLCMKLQIMGNICRKVWDGIISFVSYCDDIRKTVTIRCYMLYMNMFV